VALIREFNPFNRCNPRPFFMMFFSAVSERVPQGKLNLPRWSTGIRDLPEVRIRRSVGIHQQCIVGAVVSDWCAEVRMVEQIEKLCPELELVVLRQGEILEQRAVKIKKTGRDHGVSSQIAENADG